MSTLVSRVRVSRQQHTRFVRLDDVKFGQGPIWVSLRSTDIPANVDVQVGDGGRLVLEFSYEPEWKEKTKSVSLADGALTAVTGLQTGYLRRLSWSGDHPVASELLVFIKDAIEPLGEIADEGYAQRLHFRAISEVFDSEVGAAVVTAAKRAILSS